MADSASVYGAIAARMRTIVAMPSSAVAPKLHGSLPAPPHENVQLCGSGELRHCGIREPCVR